MLALIIAGLGGIAFIGALTYDTVLTWRGVDNHWRRHATIPVAIMGLVLVVVGVLAWVIYAAVTHRYY